MEIVGTDGIKEGLRFASMLKQNRQFERVNRTAQQDIRLTRQHIQNREVHQQNVDKMYREINKRSRANQNIDINVQDQLKLIPTKESYKDFSLQNLSMKIIDNSLSYQLADTLNKASKDIKSIPIQQGYLSSNYNFQVQNQAIRNLSSIQSIIVEAKEKLHSKIKTPLKFDYSPPDASPIFTTPHQTTGFKDRESQTFGQFKHQFIVKSKVNFLDRKEKDNQIKKKDLQDIYFSDRIRTRSNQTTENDEMRTTSFRQTSKNKITNSSKQFENSRDSLLSNHFICRPNLQRQISHKKYQCKMNVQQKFIEPLRQITMQSLKGQINPDYEQMKQLQNSLGVLTLFQDIQKPTNDVQLYKYNAERNFFGHPQKSMKKQNIVETMINKDVGIGGTFQDDIYYILSNKQEIINYLERKNY